MPGCGVLVFKDFSESRFRLMAAKAASIGIELNSLAGESEKNGFGVSWEFDPEREILRIECTSRPLFVACDFVNREIEDLVAQCVEPAVTCGDGAGQGEVMPANGQDA
jgi:hypothetical protein